MKHAENNNTGMFDLTQVFVKSPCKENFAYEFLPNDSWIGNNPYKFLGKGQFTGKIWFEDKLQMEGAIIIPMQFICSRCCANFEQNLFIPVNEIILEEDDGEHFSSRGNKIDLNYMVAQIVATNIPTQALCNENCLGVCPHCGVNLNEQNCDCDKKLRGNNPFASLMDKFN